MPQAIIENFRNGLDTRRSNLTSALGVLEVVRNAHINQGAEVEKRKAFVGIDISPSELSGVTTTFGIESLRNVIIIFGGEFNFDPLWPPVGYGYIRLYRPATNANAEVNATGVIYSTAFNGSTFAIATMADGTLACFYGDRIVTDINYFGVVLPDGDTLSKLYYSMVLAFTYTQGYTAALNNADPMLATGIIITGQDGKTFDVLASGSGPIFDVNDFVVTKLSNPVAGIPGTKAIGTFTISDLEKGRPVVNKITSILVNATELLSGAPDAIGCDISPEYTAGLITTAINANVGIGYTATNVAGTVIITADIENDSENDKVIKITTQGKVLIGNVGIKLTGSNFTVDSIKANGFDDAGVAYSVDLLTGGPYTMNAASGDTIPDLNFDIALDINTGTGTHGFVALNRGDTVKIAKLVVSSLPQAASSAQDEGTVRIVVNLTSTEGGDVNNSNSVIQVSWDTPQAEIFQAPMVTGRTAVPVKFRISGGTPPYFFQYIVEGDQGLSIGILNPDQQITHLQQTNELFAYSLSRAGGAYVPYDVRFIVPNLQVTLKVRVADSVNNETVSATIPIKLTLASKAYVLSITP